MKHEREKNDYLWAKPCDNKECAFCQDGYCLSSRDNVVNQKKQKENKVFCNGFLERGSYMYQKKMLVDIANHEGIFYISDHNIDGRKPAVAHDSFYPVKIKKIFRFHATCEVCDKSGKGTNRFRSVSTTNLVNGALAHRRLAVG